MSKELAAILCDDLKNHSHPTKGIETLKKFAEEQATSKKISEVTGVFGNIFSYPIEFQQLLSRGIVTERDKFSFLQGDIISSNSAYYIGVRVDNSPVFAIGTSTCDLSEGRRDCVILYPVKEIRSPFSDNDKQLVNNGLKFKSTQIIIVPRFPHQNELVKYNLIDLSRPHTISSKDLFNSHRMYSMTLLGWRLFSSVMSFITNRAAAGEIAIRNQINHDAREETEKIA
ncbi:hypothetical protein [Deinococcus depolymerans]|uniref:Uncharacterized protein n=1 Tax=Deinococcus depolymerans TaxID=392408 RepID=A0ABP3M347_9DEIO